MLTLEYPGWQQAAHLIDRAYPEVIAEKRVTYDFARLMDVAQTLCTSALRDALIVKIDASGGRGWRRRALAPRNRPPARYAMLMAPSR